MKSSEIESHLQHFKNGGSSLVSGKTYKAFMEGKPNIGYQPTENDLTGSMFIASKEEIDEILAKSNGDLREIEKSLGFPEGHFVDGPIIRVDIVNPSEHNLRIASGYETGANEYFNTKIDEKGELPKIEYVKNVDGSNSWMIDTQKTDPKELDKLNGQYWDEKGIYHPPNTNGYDGKTSYGINEAVINQVPNNEKNITYTRLDGFSRGQSSTIVSTPITDGYSTNNIRNDLSAKPQEEIKIPQKSHDLSLKPTESNLHIPEKNNDLTPAPLNQLEDVNHSKLKDTKDSTEDSISKIKGKKGGLDTA